MADNSEEEARKALLRGLGISNGSFEDVLRQNAEFRKFMEHEAKFAPADTVRGAIQRAVAGHEPPKSSVAEQPKDHHQSVFKSLLEGLPGELLSLPLIDAGWHAVVSGEHEGRGIVAVVSGLSIFFASSSFHWWKGLVSAKARTLLEARWWTPVVVALCFFYLVGPEMYRRATTPDLPVPTETATGCFGGPCPTYIGTPLGLAWEQYNLQVDPPPPMSAVPLRVISFGVLAKNVGSEELPIKSAYMISGIDSTKIPLKIRADIYDHPLDLEKIAPVPAGVMFALLAEFNLPQSEFLRTWATFRVVIEYGGGTARHTYSHEFIRSQLDAHDPNLRPHITLKK